MTLFLAFKLLKYLAYFRKVNLLYLTIMSSKHEIRSYFILMAGFIMSFAIFIYTIFAKKVPFLNSFGSCLMYCLLVLAGDLEQFEKIKEINLEYACIFYVPYTFMIILIFSSMFTAMNLFAFKE